MSVSNIKSFPQRDFAKSYDIYHDAARQKLLREPTISEVLTEMELGGWIFESADGPKSVADLIAMGIVK